MTEASHSHLGGWQSRTTFILALSASAVGLGNLWRFSYLAGEYGGGAFVLSYVLCLFLISAPILIAELVLGSHGRGSAVIALRRASENSQRSPYWALVGLLAGFTGLLILAYFTVVAGWGLAYAQKMHTGVFSSVSALAAGEYFGHFLNSPQELVYWLSCFLLTAVAAVALGVRWGVGVIAWVIVPLVLAILLALVEFAMRYGDLRAAQDFLFSVKWVDFSPQTVLVALGHAFFTLGIGMGVGISYGAYAPDRIPIGRSVAAVAVFDTLVSLVAGLAIFPIIFANNIEPSMGPGLMFVSLPYAFGNIAEGELFGTLFFVMVAVAALGSAVAILEAITGMLMQSSHWRRLQAVVVAGGLVWLLAVAIVMSLAAVPQDGSWSGNWNLAQLLEGMTADFLLPLVSLLTAIFVGWRMRPEVLRQELYRDSSLLFSLWRFLLRYPVPMAIILIMYLAVQEASPI